MIDLREAWQVLVGRRAALADSLAIYGEIIEAWAQAPRTGLTVAVGERDCKAAWTASEPALAHAAIEWPRETMEFLLDTSLGQLARLRPSAVPALGRFADEWDAGRIDGETVLPRRGRWAADDLAGLDPTLTAFLAQTVLRPVLAPLWDACREWLQDDDWMLGYCPCCGGPPGFADIVESGQRRLSCHLCGGEWTFPRVRCPSCGCEEARRLVRLSLDGPEEGYAVWGCRACHGYLKELDRRIRWNGGPSLVEDWGSPHFDLVALREGYHRPVPSMVVLVEVS